MNLAIPLIVMPIPTLIAVVVVYKSIQLRKAASWTEGRARITRSTVAIDHQRFAGDTTKVIHKPSVEYEFVVGSEKIQGRRIGIGELSGAALEAALERYPVGADVPVFYDPADPRRCVLDRDAPAKVGCLWAGALLLFLAGIALTFAIGDADSIGEGLQRSFPRVENPLVVLLAGAMGLACLAMWWATRREAARAAAWPVVPGRIVKSTTESFIDTGKRRTRMYRAVIEYGYSVHGREYHATRLCFGAVWSSSSRARADAEVARFPPGQDVEVHCDPDDPTSAVLECRVAGGWLLPVVALFLFGVAVYAGLHA